MADADQGLAGGVINTEAKQIGAAVGAALAVEAVAPGGRRRHCNVSGDRAAMLTAGLAALVATAVAVLAQRGDPVLALRGETPCWPRGETRAGPGE